MHGTVLYDKKHGEWATHFWEQRGEYGDHLIIGHTTGNVRHGGARHIEMNSPCGGERPRWLCRVVTRLVKVRPMGCEVFSYQRNADTAE